MINRNSSIIQIFNELYNSVFHQTFVIRFEVKQCFFFYFIPEYTSPLSLDSVIAADPSKIVETHK